MNHLLATLGALNTLAALRSDPIVGSEVSPRVRVQHFVSHVETTKLLCKRLIWHT
jgi:hypothetical protein